MPIEWILLKFNKTKVGRVKFGLPKADNFEGSLLRHMTTCCLADRFGGGGYLNSVSAFISPRIANIFAEYNQQDATFHNFFISVRRSICYIRFFCPSSGAQNCTYSVRYLSDQYWYLLLAWPSVSYWSDKYLTLYVQFWAPDDGRKNRLEHIERLTEINKLWNFASCWLYSANLYPLWLHLYRACSKITQLLIPTHAHFHWLKFFKNI